jgi:hypothetical protein
VVEDKPRYETIATAAFEGAEKTYGWDGHAHAIVRAFSELTNLRSPPAIA